MYFHYSAVTLLEYAKRNSVGNGMLARAVIKLVYRPGCFLVFTLSGIITWLPGVLTHLPMAFLL